MIGDQQALRDFVQRTKRGVYLHLPLWLLICAFVDFARTGPLVFWINCAGFSAATGLRILFLRRSAALIAERTSTARIALRILAFIPCAHWSVLAVLSTQAGALHPLMLPLILVMVGLATAGAVILSIDNTMRIWYPILALVPVGAAHLLYQPGPLNLLLAIMNAFVLIYMAAATRLVHHDYWRALEAHNLLEERANNLESLSMTDVLTQIPNRLHFERCLEEAWVQAKFKQQPVSVLLVDLDHFKNINDTYGHSVGDECLKAAAQSMSRGMLRETDRVARWGGEEFMVLLPNADRDAANVVAQRVLKAVGNTLIPHPGGVVRLACSIGVGTLHPKDRRDPRNLINDADRALYEAKTQGRNRVVASAA
jgi:diguanylate cyclase (GGDEF)-like protein